MLRQFLCILALFLGFTTLAHCAAPDTYLLKYGHMSCPKEADIESLASAKDDTELKSQLIGKIYTGACTAASLPMMRIVSVVEKTTSNGGKYYCFNAVVLDDVDDKIECAPSFFVTTLKQELAQRTGDFKIQGQGPHAIKAICTEGGTVALFNRSGIWWRASQVIPIETQEVQLAGNDLDQAIRDGCRGDDAR